MIGSGCSPPSQSWPAPTLSLILMTDIEKHKPTGSDSDSDSEREFWRRMRKCVFDKLVGEIKIYLSLKSRISITYGLGFARCVLYCLLFPKSSSL